MMKRYLLLGLVSLLMVNSLSALAHSTMKASSPASGSILEQAPNELVLTFNEPTRLTSLTIVSATGESQLQFMPSGSAEAFTSERPPLAAGRNEVSWRALSRDGHVVEGAIILVVRPRTP